MFYEFKIVFSIWFCSFAYIIQLCAQWTKAKLYSLKSCHLYKNVISRLVLTVIRVTTEKDFFSCKDQFLVMSYAQWTGRDSLRDIENCLMVLSNNLYYFGISYAVPRNTLAKANEKRDWHIYKDFAEVLLKRVRPLYAQNYFRLDLDNMVYAFDCSTISLCLELCPQLLWQSVATWKRK